MKTNSLPFLFNLYQKNSYKHFFQIPFAVSTIICYIVAPIELTQKIIGVFLDGKYYVVNVLILGICDAVFAFTKLVQPIVRYLRYRGVCVIVYIDDFFTAPKPASLFIKN